MTMKWCRNCAHWQSDGSRGNCPLHHWERERYSQDADAGGCPDYEDKASKYQEATVCKK